MGLLGAPRRFTSLGQGGVVAGVSLWATVAGCPLWDCQTEAASELLGPV